MKLKLILFLFWLNFTNIFSQTLPKNESFVRCLSLQMMGKKKNVNFFEGDNVVVKLHTGDKKQSFQILRLTDSSFFHSPYQEQNTIFDLQELKFKDIKKIYLGGNNNPIAFRGTGILGGAGVMLFTIDVLNQLKNTPVKINPTIIGVSAGLIGVSYVIKVLTNQNYRINKRHFFHLYHLPHSSPLLRPS